MWKKFVEHVDFEAYPFDLLVKEDDMASGSNKSKYGAWASRKFKSIVVMVFVPLCCALIHVPEPSLVVERPTVLYAAAIYRMATGNTAAATLLLQRAVNAEKASSSETAQLVSANKI